MPALNKGLIYDVGMHRGEDTAYYLKKGYEVVAFEANPDLAAQCRMRFSTAFASGALQIVEGAIGPPGRETIAFYQNLDKSDWGTIDEDWVLRNAHIGTRSKLVEVARVDFLAALVRFGIPYYLKIDIEGADRLVLEALAEHDARPEYISMEAEVGDLARFEDDLAMLGRLGYTRYKLVQQADIPGTTTETLTRSNEKLVHVFEAHASGPFGSDLRGPWYNETKIRDEFERCRRLALRFGERAPIRRLPKVFAKTLKGLYRFATGHKGPLPGWYDLHAAR